MFYTLRIWNMYDAASAPPALMNQSFGSLELLEAALPEKYVGAYHLLNAALTDERCTAVLPKIGTLWVMQTGRIYDLLEIPE